MIVYMIFSGLQVEAQYQKIDLFSFFCFGVSKISPLMYFYLVIYVYDLMIIFSCDLSLYLFALLLAVGITCQVQILALGICFVSISFFFPFSHYVFFRQMFPNILTRFPLFFLWKHVCVEICFAIQVLLLTGFDHFRSFNVFLFKNSLLSSVS